MSRPSDPRPCRDSSCDVAIIFARRAFTSRWLAYEATALPPFTEAAAGCHVIVADHAFTTAEAIEHFQVGWELSEPDARRLVADYPFHRPHIHEAADSQHTPGPSTTDTKEHARP